ncbi:MAG: hypothetical protein AAGA54_28810, partial [Myxococcota bacterium]
FDDHSKLIKGVELVDAATLVSYSSDKTLRQWRFDGSTLSCERVLEGHKGLVTGARMLDAERLASWDNKNQILIWDLATGTQLVQLDSGDDAVDKVALLDDGSALSWSRKSKHYGRWDLGAGERLERVGWAESREQRPLFWRTKLELGHMDTLLGRARANGVDGGLALYIDAPDAASTPRAVRWYNTGTWTADTLHAGGVVAIHANNYLHVLHPWALPTPVRRHAQTTSASEKRPTGAPLEG